MRGRVGVSSRDVSPSRYIHTYAHTTYIHTQPGPNQVTLHTYPPTYLRLRRPTRDIPPRLRMEHSPELPCDSDLHWRAGWREERPEFPEWAVHRSRRAPSSSVRAPGNGCMDEYGRMGMQTARETCECYVGSYWLGHGTQALTYICTYGLRRRRRRFCACGFWWEKLVPSASR